MRRYLLSVFVLIVAGLYGCDSKVPTTEVYDGMPPERFRGDNTATKVVFTTHVELDCTERGLSTVPGTVVVACARVGKETREITVLNPCLAKGDYAKAFCHELGHLNGWPYNHGE